MLRAFTERQTDRYFLKAERTDPRMFTLFFSGGDAKLPEVKGINFNSNGAFLMENTENKDTVRFWLRDTLLVNQDTLRMQLTYMATDTLGNLVTTIDTLDVLSKTPYAKRLKDKARAYDEWKKTQEKAKKRGRDYQETMPAELLEPKYSVKSQPDPDQNIIVDMPVPLASVDTSKIHLYAKHDTLWYRSKFIFREKKAIPRRYEVIGEWRPDVEYSFEVDSAAFVDIYGNVCAAYKQGLKVKSEDEYGTLLMTINGSDSVPRMAQLLDTGDRVVKTVKVENGNAEFFYITPGTYYMRMFCDVNGNGIWDTGDYSAGLQAEQTFYYPEKIECKAKWDITLSWSPEARDAAHQKPYAITKQKADKDKTVKHRNAERAKKMGIQYIPK